MFNNLDTDEQCPVVQMSVYHAQFSMQYFHRVTTVFMKIMVIYYILLFTFRNKGYIIFMVVDPWP